MNVLITWIMVWVPASIIGAIILAIFMGGKKEPRFLKSRKYKDKFKGGDDD